MHFRLLGGAAAGVAVAAALAGCGGASSNGIASRPASQIVIAAQRAAEQASTVHLAGSTVNGGQSLGLDLDVVNGTGARGTIAAGGYRVAIVDLDGSVYLKGTNGFWRHFAGDAAARTFHGKWLKAPANGDFSAFTQFTDLKGLFSRLLSSQGQATKLGRSTVSGRPVVNVRLSSPPSRLSVVTTGRPYPVAVSAAGSGGGRIVFSRYNQAVTITAPTGALDISRFSGAGTPSSAG